MKLAAIGLLCALVVACGGDGGSTPEVTPETANPEGFWVGTTSDGSQVHLSVLENGEIWGDFFGKSSINHVLWGHVSKSGFQLNGGFRKFNRLIDRFLVSEFSGTFYPRDRMDITLADGTHLPMKFETLYDREMDPKRLTGTHAGDGGLRGQPLWRPVPLLLPDGELFQGSEPIESFTANALRVTDSGEAHLQTDKDCDASGAILPRASGKNVFDVKLTFRGSECGIVDGSTFNGIAVQRWNKTARIHALNEAKTIALDFAFIGNK